MPEVVGTIASNCGPKSHDAGNFHCNQGVDAGHIIAHTLRSRGFDGSEDGTGRGTPIVPVAFQSKASCTQCMNPSETCPTMDSMGGAFDKKPMKETYGIFDEPTPKIGNNIMPTLRGRETGGGFQQSVGTEKGNRGVMMVRRLTPL